MREYSAHFTIARTRTRTHLEDLVSLLQLDLVVLVQGHHGSGQQARLVLSELVGQRGGPHRAVPAPTPTLQQQPGLLNKPIH